MMPPTSAIITWKQGQPPVKMGDTDTIWNDSVQGPYVDAHVYAGWSYDYMLHILGRNSFDNLGKGMNTIVDDTAYPYGAIFNDTTDIVYVFRPDTTGKRYAAAAIDLIAHEWGHGITKYASNLPGNRYEGALAESFSDMLGVWIGFVTNNANWMWGENTNTNGEPIHDLQFPHNGYPYPQPDTVGDVIHNWRDPSPDSCPVANDFNDSCYVHFNCSIPSKMFQLLSDGGNHYGVNVTAIGLTNAMRIMYRANATRRWAGVTTFAEAAAGSIRAAFELDSSGTWSKRTGKAWEAVRVCKAIPGDANASGTYTLGDAISIVNYLFNLPGCSPQPLCWLSGLPCRGDCNGDWLITLNDAIRMISFMFNKPCFEPYTQGSACWLPLPSRECCTYP